MLGPQFWFRHQDRRQQVLPFMPRLLAVRPCWQGKHQHLHIQNCPAFIIGNICLRKAADSQIRKAIAKAMCPRVAHFGMLSSTGGDNTLSWLCLKSKLDKGRFHLLFLVLLVEFSTKGGGGVRPIHRRQSDFWKTCLNCSKRSYSSRNEETNFQIISKINQKILIWLGI